MLFASSNLRPSFAGIANWFVENGTMLIRTREGDHPSVRSLKAQSSNLLKRIPMGIWQNPRRTHQAEFQGFTVNHPKCSQSTLDQTISRSQWIHWLVKLDQALQGSDPGLRFLYRGNHLAQNDLCSFLHRIRFSSGPHRWNLLKSQWILGISTSSAIGLGITRKG